MLKFSNDDYSTPRERMSVQRGRNWESSARNDMNLYRCDGTRRYDNGSKCDTMIPASCSGNAALASVYSPHQEYKELFDSMSALCNGTLFKELYKPLKGGICIG